jgi:uncharacterized OB-fold protein
MAEKRPDRVHGGQHDKFWAYCEGGELRLQRCGDCTRVTWPVASACQYCSSKNLAFQPMSGRGKLVSWVTFERDYYGGGFPIPWETILVELEEGPLFVSNPLGFSRDQMTFEMPLKVAFLDCEDSAGAFKLPVFETA